MGFFRRLVSNEPLFQGMADRLGADLGDWVAQDPQHAGDYRSAVLTCAACTAAGDCRTWEEAHAAADKAPDYCRNRHLLEKLAKA